jgi:D-amino peptidase
MRIYIHTDLEGVSGVGRGEMVPTESEDYRHCCEMLMGDLNAAIDGAFEGGAEHVTVLDSHGSGGFVRELLDPRAEEDLKPNKKWWGIMDDSFDATFFIGAHAMAGTMCGFLDHTQSSASWFEYSINGRPMGELGQWALVAGNWGLPLVMVAGDEAACLEATRFFDPCRIAAVKRGLSRQRAECYDLEEARARIRRAAKEAIAIIPDAKPFAPNKPMEILLTFTRADYADSAATHPGVERIDARTVRKVTDDPLELFL